MAVTAEVTVNTVSAEVEISEVTVEITVGTGFGTGGYIQVPGTWNIVKNQPFIVDTGQSTRKPIGIEVFDSNDKRISKNLAEPTVSLDTNYIITFPAGVLSFSNVNVYYSS